MNKKIVASLFSLLVISLACKSAAQSIPTEVAMATPTLAPRSLPTNTQSAATDTPSAAGDQSDSSFTDSAPATRQQIADALAHTRNANRDITYCTVDGVDLKMDMFSPKGTTGMTPLAIFIHGGGWSKGDKRAGAGMADFPALLDAGFMVATLDYRLAPLYRFPAMIDDVKCAIRFFRANAAQYDIDPNKIGVWGISAGSHLAILLGVTDPGAGFDVGQYLDQSSRVQAVVDMSGPADLTVDFSAAFVKARNIAFVGYDLAKASPITYITPDDPPFLIFQGDKDPVVPIDQGQAQKLYDGLTAEGVPAQLVIVHGGPHLLDAPDQMPSRAELTRMIVDFFNRHLR